MWMNQPYPSDGVHCPVCNTYYSPSQTNQHLLKHTIHYQPPKDQTPTQVSFNDDLHSYPFVEPLQFDTADLSLDPDHSLFRSTFNLRHSELNRRDGGVRQLVDCATQTADRPLLQYRSEETDLFNCFDAAFNGGSFSKKDIVSNNVGLASKRPLTEWEQARHRKWR